MDRTAEWLSSILVPYVSTLTVPLDVVRSSTHAPSSCCFLPILSCLVPVSFDFLLLN